MSLLGDLLAKAKGPAVSIAGKQILAAYLHKYGTMLNFNVDPATRTIHLEMLLKGEEKPVQITLRGYEIVEAAGGKLAALRVTEVQASREWLAVVLRQFVQGREIPLPANAAPLLKLLM